MRFTVIEPVIVAGRLRLRGETISGADAEEVSGNEMLLRSCTKTAEAEPAKPPAPSRPTVNEDKD